MNHNEEVKHFSYITTGRVVETIFLGIFYVTLASLLDPEEYGSLNVIIALAGTFSIISRFGLNLSIQVFQSKNDSVVVSSINTLFLISTIVATIILITIDIYAALLCLGISFFVMNSRWLLGLRQYKQFMWINILKSAFIFSLPFPLYFFLDIPGIILGMAIASLIPSFQYLKHIKLSWFKDMKQNYKILVNNFGFDISGTLPLMIDKLIISTFFGLYVVGIYQLNLQIFLAISIIPASLSSYLISEESRGFTHLRFSVIIIVSSIAIAVLGIFLSPFVITEFFPKYSEGIIGLQILLLTIFPQSIATVFTAKLMAKKSTKLGYLAFIKIISIIVLIIYLGELYNFVGLSLAVLLSSVFSLIFLVFISKKY